MTNKLISLLSGCVIFLLIICVSTVETQTKSKKIKSKTSKSQSKKNEVTDYEKKLLDDVEKQLEENRPTNIYAFVGEKKEIKSFEPPLEKDQIMMDRAFKAKYKVIQKVYGNYEKDIIEFEVYDHYGTPSFSNYQNVLLFVSEYGGKLYHEKYQYFDVYKTKDGRWASCGDSFRFDEYHLKQLKPVSLEFAEPVVFDLEKLATKQIKEFYPKPFFAIEGNKAVCLMGNYLDELFWVKRTGVLKARRIFK